jgi:catalase
LHRQAIARGRVAYEPNSLAAGCPFQQGAVRGFTSFPDSSPGDKVRGKPEKFADHYTQATLFYRSQTPVEQAHIVRGFRFELTKVQVPAIRERMVASLANVDADLAAQVAAGLGIEVPAPMPRLVKPIKPEVVESPALSLMARPGDGSIRGRKIAILVADGVDGESARAICDALSAVGAVPRFVAARLAPVAAEGGGTIEPDATLETTPSVLYDAVAIPGGSEAAAVLGKLGQALEFVKDQYRHCKAILAVGAAQSVLEGAGILPDESDPALIVAEDGTRKAIERFTAAIARHRNWDRAMDPPPV